MADKQADDLQNKRAQAVKTAWVLGIISVAIFATFVGSAVLGH